MAYSRTFDADRVLLEMPAICGWLRACGVRPADVPTGATLVVHRRRMTVEVFRRGPNGGRVLNADQTDVARETRTVRYRRPPRLDSLGRPQRRGRLVQPRTDHAAARALEATDDHS